MSTQIIILKKQNQRHNTDPVIHTLTDKKHHGVKMVPQKNGPRVTITFDNYGNKAIETSSEPAQWPHNITESAFIVFVHFVEGIFLQGALMLMTHLLQKAIW